MSCELKSNNLCEHFYTITKFKKLSNQINILQTNTTKNKSIYPNKYEMLTTVNIKIVNLSILTFIN